MSREPYTVRKLIATLTQLDPDAHVFVEGYESGMNDLGAVELVSVAVDANNDDFGGPHTYYDAEDDGDIPRCEGYLLR